MASVSWTVASRRDLREIIEFIARDSATYAAVTGDRILDAVEHLRRFPELGRIVPEYDDRSLRELLVGDYRVVYRLRRARVVVVAITHGRRDLERRRRGEPWRFD